MILAYRFQMANSITAWITVGRGGVREEAAIFSCSQYHTSLSPRCTDSCQSLGKTLVSNNHITLSQTEVVAQWKYGTPDLVHTQRCTSVGCGVGQMKIKLTCFQLGGVYSFPFTDSGSFFKLLKGLLWWRRHKFLCNALRRGCLRRCPCHLQKAALFSVPILTTWAPRTTQVPGMKCSPYFIGLTEDVTGEMFKTQGRQMTWAKAAAAVQESAGMELTSRGGRSFIEVIYLSPQCLLEHHENSTGKSQMFWGCMPVHSSLSALCGTAVFDRYW